MQGQYNLILNNSDMKLAVDFYTGYPNVHFELYCKPTHNLIKYIRDVMLEELLVILGVNGHEMLLAVIPSHDKKLKRFCNLMNFEEESTTRGFTLLAQDIV